MHPKIYLPVFLLLAFAFSQDTLTYPPEATIHLQTDIIDLTTPTDIESFPTIIGTGPESSGNTPPSYPSAYVVTVTESAGDGVTVVATSTISGLLIDTREPPGSTVSVSASTTAEMSVLATNTGGGGGVPTMTATAVVTETAGTSTDTGRPQTQTGAAVNLGGANAVRVGCGALALGWWLGC